MFMSEDDMDSKRQPVNLEGLIERTEYGKELEEVLDIYIPLLVQLPSLRDNPEMLQSEVKAEGAGGVQDIVTAADVYVQDEIKKRLIDSHPDWQFWGEEGGGQVTELDASKKFLLVADPIEGTNNFRARKDDQWGSVLALVNGRTGEPIMGLVAHPSQNKLYLGVKREGAYEIDYDQTGRVISFTRMSPEPEFSEFTYNNSPHFEQNLRFQVDRFFQEGKIIETDTDDVLEKSRKKVLIRNNGEEVSFLDPESGALEAVRYRGTLYFKTSNEMAAVFVILNELGGRVTDAEGKPWHLGINTLIAARNSKDYNFLKSIYDRTLASD